MGILDNGGEAERNQFLPIPAHPSPFFHLSLLQPPKGLASFPREAEESRMGWCWKPDTPPHIHLPLPSTLLKARWDRGEVNTEERFSTDDLWTYNSNSMPTITNDVLVMPGHFYAGAGNGDTESLCWIKVLWSDHCIIARSDILLPGHSFGWADIKERNETSVPLLCQSPLVRGILRWAVAGGELNLRGVSWLSGGKTSLFPPSLRKRHPEWCLFFTLSPSNLKERWQLFCQRPDTKYLRICGPKISVATI